ncbi:DUF1683 family protein [Pelomyxa schiedti]|nr:DUF1683 family protein [Pelomyxa schiedti]
MDEYPDEIRRLPLPVVGVVGGSLQVNNVSLESMLFAATCQAQLAHYQSASGTQISSSTTTSSSPNTNNTTTTSAISAVVGGGTSPVSGGGGGASSVGATSGGGVVGGLATPGGVSATPAVAAAVAAAPASSSSSSSSSSGQPTMLNSLYHAMQHLALCHQKRGGDHGLTNEQQLNILQSLLPTAKSPALPLSLQQQLNQTQQQIQAQQGLPVAIPIHGRLAVHSLADVNLLPGEKKKKELDGYLPHGLLKSSWLFKKRGWVPQQLGASVETEEAPSSPSIQRSTTTPISSPVQIPSTGERDTQNQEPSETSPGLNAEISSPLPLPGSLTVGSPSGTSLGSSPPRPFSSIPAIPSTSPPVPASGLVGVVKNRSRKCSPACVVLFFQLTDERQWPQKQTEILSAVQQSRRLLRGRSTKIIVSLILNTSVADVNDEHVALLKKNSAHDEIFLACGTAEVKAHIAHIEKTAHEAALTHYAKEIHKKIGILSHVTKSASPLTLNTRISFKIAHLNEFRQDTPQAIKYYQQAYTQLRELKQTEEKRQDQLGSITLNEIKLLADWINFKLVTMHYLLTQNLSEAVQQFHKHMLTYKRIVNLPEIEFDHWGWVAKQYKAFAEILQLIPTLIPAYRGQRHPSFYYQAAAQYTMERRRHASVACEPLRESPLLPDVKHLPKAPYMKLDYTAQFYLGQLGSSNSTAVDYKVKHSHTEHVYALIAYELYCVDHTRFALSLYNAAFTEYMSVPHVKRAMCSLSCQIAICHYQLEEWEKAKSITDKLAENYRNEQWWDMLAVVIAISRDCARRIGGDRHTPHFISTSLELLLPYMPTTELEKKCIQSSITRVIDKIIGTDISTFRKPALHFGKSMPDLMLTNVEKLSLSSSLRINLAQSYPLLSCEVYWKQTVVCAGDPLVFMVKITSRFVSEIRFSLLRAIFQDTRFSTTWTNNPPTSSPNPTSILSADLLLAPGAQKVFTCEIVPKDLDHLECMAVTLAYGSDSGPYLEFAWKVSEWTQMNTDPCYKPVTSVRITERPSHLKISVVHTSPALIDELYECAISLKNNEERSIQGGSIMFEIRDNPIYLFDMNGNKHPVSSLNFNQIPHMGTFTTSIFVQCQDLSEKMLQIKVVYTTDDGYRTSTTHSESIIPQKPFLTRFNFFDADTLLPVSPLAQPQPISPSTPNTAANKTAANLLASNPTTCLSLSKPFLVNMVLQPHASTTFPLHLHELSLNIASSNSNEIAVKLLAVTPALRAQPSSDTLFSLTRDQQHNSWFMLEAQPPDSSACSSTPPPPSSPGRGGASQTSSKKLTPLGTLNLVWSRSPASPHRVTTAVSFPKVEFTNPPWRWHIENDTEGVVGVPLNATLVISNFAAQPQDFIMQVKDHGKFLVAGMVSCNNLTVPPHNTVRFPLCFIPQAAGSQCLPPICVAPKALCELMPNVSVVFSSCAPPVIYPKPVFIRPCTSPCTYLR